MMKVYKVCFERVKIKNDEVDLTEGCLGEIETQFNKQKNMIIKSTDFETAEKEVESELQQLDDSENYQTVIYSSEELNNLYVSKSWIH